MNIITEEYLDANPSCIFVFGDNLIRKGTGGAAKLRHHPQTYGFITKKYPNNASDSFFNVPEYRQVFETELAKLVDNIIENPNKVFLISKLGGGLANKYRIFEEVIQPGLQCLKKYPNVKFLWSI